MLFVCLFCSFLFFFCFLQGFFCCCSFPLRSLLVCYYSVRARWKARRSEWDALERASQQDEPNGARKKKNSTKREAQQCGDNRRHCNCRPESYRVSRRLPGRLTRLSSRVTKRIPLAPGTGYDTGTVQSQSTFFEREAHTCDTPHATTTATTQTKRKQQLTSYQHTPFEVAHLSPSLSLNSSPQ